MSDWVKAALCTDKLRKLGTLMAFSVCWQQHLTMIWFVKCNWMERCSNGSSKCIKFWIACSVWIQYDLIYLPQLCMNKLIWLPGSAALRSELLTCSTIWHFTASLHLHNVVMLWNVSYLSHFVLVFIVLHCGPHIILKLLNGWK